MRAARVLDMLLVLQRRRKTTARELATLLEVSERTILRDVEALAEAGVPIFTTRGVGGGIELMNRFRTHLTGLTSDEAESLFLAGQPRVAHRLGMAAPARSVRHKLLTALAPQMADQADDLASWFVHDPDPWTGNRISHGELRRLVRCIRQHRRVELAIGHAPTVVAQPLGLVLKAGSWHLVCAEPDGIGVRCIDELRAVRITNKVFSVPPDFNLTRFWDGVSASDVPISER